MRDDWRSVVPAVTAHRELDVHILGRKPPLVATGRRAKARETFRRFILGIQTKCSSLDSTVETVVSTR